MTAHQLFADTRFQPLHGSFYRLRKFGTGDYEIIGRDGSHYSSQWSERTESYDLFDHSIKRFLIEEGLSDIDEVVAFLDTSRE